MCERECVKLLGRKGVRRVLMCQTEVRINDRVRSCERDRQRERKSYVKGVREREKELV